MKWTLAIACVLITSQFASAQIIFAPVQYQYGAQSKFYYGGSDPGAIARAEQSWVRVNGFAFTSGTVEHFRDVSFEPLRAYSDLMPHENAAIYGYTANDARMAAYANVPRYFRKSDLIAAAIPVGDGTLVVPAHAQPIHISHPAQTTSPAPVPILIIPKGQLLPPPKSNNVVIVRN